MTNQRKTDLLKEWDSLAPNEQDELLHHLEFPIEKSKPSYQAEAKARDKAFDAQMEKISDLKSDLDEAKEKARVVIANSCPSKEIRELFGYYYLVVHYAAVAKHHPTAFYGKGKRYSRIAKSFISEVSRRLAKLEKAQV